MTPNSNDKKIFRSNFEHDRVQTFLEVMDRHQQLVHREVRVLVVEVKHMLMRHDAVDHHYIKQKQIHLIKKRNCDKKP